MHNLYMYNTTVSHRFFKFLIGCIIDSVGHKSFADFSSVFLFSLRVAEAEVGVLRQDVHIVITTGPENAADLQDIIGSFGLNCL